ncbi:ABC transporter permease [Keratinibaculum paraultunense]|uniref:ABC transporter permease n=1 Tax=Keratinibaculum paraultunense TaxID=1278232 RepID=UPI00192AB972|nr:ABC transporter permease [Keratinibaculum paraultunense]QQY79086.1 ABC transporter permease [Keratinibaculum paraultunense]
MANMKIIARIIKFELKKILSSKLTIGALIISYLILIYSFVPNIFKYTFYDDNGNLLKRKQAVNYEKEFYKEYLNQVQTDERIRANIENLKEHYIVENNKTGFEYDKALPKDIYYGYYKPRESYFYWLSQNFISGPYPHILMIEFDELGDFYVHRQKNIETWFDSMNLTSTEREFWQQRANITKGPYQYGYYQGWNYINDSLDIVVFLVLAIGIGISGVFSEEHETGMDAILLSAKYGRTKLVTGKITASLIFAIVVVLVGLLLCVVPILLFFGTEGWNLPIQVLDAKILYNWTLLKTIGIRIFMSFLSALAVATIALSLSSKIKKTTPVAVIVILFYLGGLFIPVERGNRIFQKITRLLPAFLSGRQYYGLVTYSFFGKVLTFYHMAIAVYILLILILLPLSMIFFKKHQVE